MCFVRASEGLEAPGTFVSVNALSLSFSSTHRSATARCLMFPNPLLLQEQWANACMYKNAARRRSCLGPFSGCIQRFEPAHALISNSCLNVGIAHQFDHPRVVPAFGTLWVFMNNMASFVALYFVKRNDEVKMADAL